MFPSDRHVHSEWSWDAPFGSMEKTCEHAMQLGIRSIAFTEHADFTSWSLPEGAEARPPEHLRLELPLDGTFTPPPLDVAGYRRSVEHCRERFPGLEILFGVELSEPHWNPSQASHLLDQGGFDFVICGLHSLRGPEEDRFVEIGSSYHERTAPEVVASYLTELLRLVEGWDRFEVLSHIDYPLRHWPMGGGVYAPSMFEGEYRRVLRALAERGKTLEVNTRLPLDPIIVSWWREEGGRSVSFGSDAHQPLALGSGFIAAADSVREIGFRPGRHRHDHWMVP